MSTISLDTFCKTIVTANGKFAFLARSTGKSKRKSECNAKSLVTVVPTIQGVASLERRLLNAPLDDIVLSCGLLYGPGMGFGAPIAPGSVQDSAAAKAA